MSANYHTHTTFCDGKNTPEEIVLYAIEKGFTSIGLSGHGNTPFDLRYCMKDTDGYVSEVNRVKKKYADKIQVYCGVEEDAFSPVKRDNFDYIIGSSHYFCVDEKYYPIDSNYDYFKKCLEVFEYDVEKLSKTYYEFFVNYIRWRKPDIVGHFDLVTKFDEIDITRFINNSSYLKIAEYYFEKAIDADVIFELNTGAIARGLKKAPYPSVHLLHILKKRGGKLTLSSDSHSIDTLDFYFDEAKNILRDIGFDGVYELDGGVFKKQAI